MVRVGLIGFGLAGQAFHAPVIRGVRGMELACILERRGTRAREKYPEVRVARTLEELLADKEIQLCVIATPNDSHFEYARACLVAGRDVVVDKPFAPTLHESEEHDVSHEDLQAQFKRMLSDGRVKVEDRVRMAAAFGAVISGIFIAGDAFDDVPSSELADWYTRAMIFAFPSLDEGFGMPVLEAMASGTPVIASNRSALPEVAGDAAWLVNPEDTEELAGALVALTLDPNRRADLSLRGLARAARFRWGDAVEKTWQVYCELAATN